MEVLETKSTAVSNTCKDDSKSVQFLQHRRKTRLSFLQLGMKQCTCTATHSCTRGQFHQLFGVKRKCEISYQLAQKNAIQFHQQNSAQLHWCIGLDVTPNFYFLRSEPHAIKSSVNLQMQKLLIK